MNMDNGQKTHKKRDEKQKRKAQAGKTDQKKAHDSVYESQAFECIY